MATLQARVEDYTGSFADTAALSQWLTEGARVVIQALPPEFLWLVAQDLTDSGTGVSVTTARILYAHKAGRYAIRIPSNAKALYDDSNSIWKATDFAPVFYTELGKAYVVGDTDGGTVGVVSYPTVTFSDSVITGYPVEVDHLPVLYAASRVQQSRAYSTAAPAVPGAVTPPVAPVLDVASYTTPVYGPPDITILLNIPSDLTLTLPSAPSLTWSAPTISLPLVPTFSTFTVSASAPTAPLAPAISATDALVGSIGSTTIGALPTVPTFGTATFGGNIADITSGLPSAIDLANEIDGITALDPPVAPTPPSITSGTIADVTIGALPVSPPAYTPVSPSLTFTTWDTYQGLEDPEMMREVLQKISLELQELATQIQDNQITFQSNVEAYRAAVQKVIEQARIELQEKGQELSEANRTTLEDYALKLQQHDRDMAKYQAEIDRQVAEVQANLAIAVSGKAERERLWVQKYQADIQKESEIFRGAIEDHMAEVNRLIQQAQLDQQRLVETGRLTTDLNLRNEAQTLQAAIADYEMQLRRYEGQIRSYQIEVEAEVQDFVIDEIQIKMVKWQEEAQQALRKFEADITAETNRLRAASEAYLNEVQAKTREYEAKTGRALRAYEAESQILVQGFRADLDASVADFQAQVQAAQLELEAARFANDSKAAVYQAQVMGFQAESQENIRLFEGELGLFVQARQGYLADAEQLMSRFREELSIYIGRPYDPAASA